MEINYIESECTLHSRNFFKDHLVEVGFILDQDIPWIPGQFINLSVATKTWRSYSIVDLKDRIATFLVDLRPGGVGSMFMKDAPIGTRTGFIGPLGRFVIDDPLRDMFFVATGTGIAPIIPMIKANSYQFINGKVKLLYGVRFDDEDLLDEYFDEDDLAKVEVVRCITKSNKSSGIFKGRVTDYISNSFSDLSNNDIFICGNPVMVVEVVELTKALGAKNIHTEKY